MPPACEIKLPTRDYDLTATMTSGQVFAWAPAADGWVGVVGGCWVRLRSEPDGIRAWTARPVADWGWLREFLQPELNLPAVLASFPDDPHLGRAVAACHGLRLLRQEPWECLASFILSSTKQIVQIRQIVRLLCQRHGTPVAVPPGVEPAFAFPSAVQIATLTETDLRACKMGFRAKYLLAAARQIATGEVALASLGELPLASARAELMNLPGVGEKIADCVLLFAYDFPAAFPVDVWVARALRQFYFPRRRKTLPELRRFVARHFGPNAGYAQQYLFHHIRTKSG